MRKRGGKIFFFFFFSFLFQTLRFFRKIGQSFLCFSDFPKFTKPAKTFKNTSNLPNFQLPYLDSSSTTQSTQYIHIYIYTYVHFNHHFNHQNILNFYHQNILNFFNSMHFFYQKIGLEPDLIRPPTYLVH